MKCEITVPRRRGLSLAHCRDIAARLACKEGGRVLDVGTGACACQARVLARCHVHVTAIDSASTAIRFAQEVAALPHLRRWLEVQQADAARMPFADGSYRTVIAFDSFGHSSVPHLVLGEMYHVCAHSGLVLITEYNRRGRRATRHSNFGFETRLAKMLRRHCSDCRRIEQPHHVTFVCRRKPERE
jgi:ubiquinone/menaquinone biosynthesis C-methylase UbiE